MHRPLAVPATATSREETPLMRPCVFVHTNHKQYLGALVSAYSFRRYAAQPDTFDVRIIHTRDYPFLRRHEGEEYLRDGVRRRWRYDDLQSFTTLRFMPPELMGYQSRAVVVDPDVFALGDVGELLARDMADMAIVCRARRHPLTEGGSYNSSVMLLDNARLRHWRVEEQLEAMFQMKRDYRRWITLGYEDPRTIGELGREWNDLDHLDARTKLIHNTHRRTQPWKRGLPVDFIPAERFRLFPPIAWAMRLRRRLFGDYALLGTYRQHPDKNQENLFFGLVKECLEKGIVTEAMIRDEMRQNHVRHDALAVVRRVPPLTAQPLAA
jgi:hypothetical protein